MPHEPFDSRKDSKNQDVVIKPIENTKDRPPKAIPEKRTISFQDGEEITISSTALRKNKQGEWEKVITEIPMQDASGRFVSPETIVACSWTGLTIPSDHFTACLNPWGDHGYRLVYLNIDGFLTDLGNILCTACFAKNKKKRKLKKYLSWFYNPEIF